MKTLLILVALASPAICHAEEWSAYADRGEKVCRQEASMYPGSSNPSPTIYDSCMSRLRQDVQSWRAQESQAQQQADAQAKSRSAEYDRMSPADKFCSAMSDTISKFQALESQGYSADEIEQANMKQARSDVARKNVSWVRDEAHNINLALLKHESTGYILDDQAAAQVWATRVKSDCRVAFDKGRVGFANQNSVDPKLPSTTVQASNTAAAVPDAEDDQSKIRERAFDENDAYMKSHRDSKLGSAMYDTDVKTYVNERNIETSFDCSKTSTGAEHLICNDFELSADDVFTAKVYATMRAHAPEKVSELRAHARSAINDRDQCRTKGCLREWFDAQSKYYADFKNRNHL